MPGTLTLGAPQGGVGFRGWVDELEVFAEAPVDEVLCNHARGTLVGLGAKASDPWMEIAGAYPPWAHARIGAAVQQAGGAIHDLYACFYDHEHPIGATMAALPAGTSSLRSLLLFPEGPLVFGQPRPDSSGNAPDSLSPEALVAKPGVMMQDDPRRQPLQPPRLVFGHVPAGMLAPGIPAQEQLPEPWGHYLDQWVYPP